MIPNAQASVLGKIADAMNQERNEMSKYMCRKGEA